MDGQSTTHAHTDQLRPVALLGDLITALVGLLLALQGVVAVVLLVRRAQGAMAPASSPGWLIVWMTLAVAVVAATRIAVGRFADRDSGLAMAARYLPTAALVVTALALTSFRAPWAVFFVWVLVAAEEGAIALVQRRGLSGTFGRIGWRPAGRSPAFHAPSHARSVAPVVNEPPLVDGAAPPAGTAGLCEGVAPGSASLFSQRLERVQSMGGADRLAGTLTARFAPGQVTAHVHVAFCPPFSRVPQLDFRQVAGPSARIKVGQLLPHGVRFDVKREGPATDSASLCLEMRAAYAAETGTLAREGNLGSNR
jgi:hypothetical protein